MGLQAALVKNEKLKVVIQKKGLKMTELGKQFCHVCVISHEEKGLPKKTYQSPEPTAGSVTPRAT